MARVLLDPNDLQVAYRGDDGHPRLLYFDTQYNDSFALLHHNAYKDAFPIDLDGVDGRRLAVKLLTPLDLAVSKLARFSEQDQEDISMLVKEGLFDAAQLRQRADGALPDYVGNLDRIKNSIDIACRQVAPQMGETSAPHQRGPRK